MNRDRFEALQAHKKLLSVTLNEVFLSLGKVLQTGSMPVPAIKPPLRISTFFFPHN
jgi:hypothetical protein